MMSSKGTPVVARLRVATLSGKVGYVSAAAVAGFLLTALAQFGLGDAWGIATGAVVTAAAVGVGVRVFRGSAEPVAPPRAWWRMTSRAPAGWVLAAVFALSGAAGVTTLVVAPATVLGIAVDLAIALAYANSSWRLTRRTGRARRTE